MVSLILLMLAPTAVVSLRQPVHSWHTVPVFCETSNITGPFDDEATKTIAKFPLFVGEKAYDFASSGFAEDKLSTLGKKLRGLNPSIRLVFYYNANLDLTDYRLYNVTAQHAPSWWVRNSSGDVLIAPIDSGAGAKPPFPYKAGVPVYDFTVAEMRDAWVEECFRMTSSTGGYDGCMVDRWTRTPFKGKPGFTPDYIQKWVDARDKATASLATRANAAGMFLVGEGAQVSAISDPGYGYGGVKSLQQQMSLAAKGQGILASYAPTSTGQRFVNQLALFLLGAWTNHFFGAGSWTCDHTSREGVTWHGEYDKPLGRPLNNATLHNGVYSRNFAYGTNVSYDTSTDIGTIEWGTFPSQ